MSTTQMPVTTYKEKQIGKTTYRVTSVFTGEKDLGKTLEKLAVDRVLNEIKSGTKSLLNG